MSNYRTIETTATGWKQIVGSQVSYQNASGTFVTREDYVAEREASGYGDGGYGQ